MASPANPSGSSYNEDTQLNEDSEAAFAQLDWQFDPTFKLTGGIRYSSDRKYGQEAFRLILFNFTGGLNAASLGANTPAVDATALDCQSTLYQGAGACAINATTGQGVRSLEARWDAFTGTANLVVVVVASTNLASPAWVPLATNTLTGGTSYFSDPQWTNYPRRFYRFSSP